MRRARGNRPDRRLAVSAVHDPQHRALEGHDSSYGQSPAADNHRPPGEWRLERCSAQKSARRAGLEVRGLLADARGEPEPVTSDRGPA
jgi:hypothetical protein